MNLFDIPAVVIILGLVSVTVIRAFASSRADHIDMFIRRSQSPEK